MVFISKYTKSLDSSSGDLDPGSAAGGAYDAPPDPLGASTPLTKLNKSITN